MKYKTSSISLLFPLLLLSCELGVHGPEAGAPRSVQEAVITLDDFSVPADTVYSPAQKDPSGVTLIKVTGEKPTVIAGEVNAPGSLVIENPNGIVIEETAVIEAGGFTAKSEKGDVLQRGTIRARAGSIQLGAPSGNIDNSGAIEILGPAENGARLIDLKAEGIYLRDESTLEASGSSPAGGVISLESDGVTEVRGIIRARGEGPEAIGGTIMLLGERVGVLENAVGDAGGFASGGRIMVGGDYQGKNPLVKNARFAYVHKQARLTADAHRGDGGTVIVWSDNHTYFAGKISARGKGPGGDGGFAEVSGLRTLDYLGFADLTSSEGKTGTLLLDPTSFDIGAANDPAEYVWNPGGFPLQYVGTGTANMPIRAQLGVAVLNAQLNATSVTVNTNGVFPGPDPGQFGRIYILGAISWNNANNLTLNAAATGEIHVYAGGSITCNGGGSLNMTAGVQAGISVAIEDTITLNGGNFNCTSTTGTFTTSAAINVGNGSITINHQGNVTIGADLTGNAGVSILTSGGTMAINSVLRASTGAVNVGSSGAMTIAATGNIVTTSGNVNIGQGQPGAISTAGDVNTTTGSVSYLRNVTLTGTVIVTTTNVPGAVSFSGTMNGGSGVSLNLNGGNVTFSQEVGGTARIGTLSISNAGTINAAAAITAANIVQAGANTATYDGILNTNQDTGVNLSGTAININAGVDTTTAPATDGVVTINNSGLLTVAVGANMNLSGDFIQNGTGNVSLGGDITTSADPISFARAVTLTNGVDEVALNTGAGGGDITFSSTVTASVAGARNLTLTAGTGTINFNAAVGATRLGILTINSANAINTTAAASITAASINATSSVSATYNGALNANTLAGISLTGAAITINSTVTTVSAPASNGTVTITNTGLLTIAAAGDMNLDGAFTQGGGGTVTTGGDIVTTDDNIQFGGAVTLSGNVLLDTGAVGAGDISFSNSVTGAAQTLTLRAGTGDLYLRGVTVNTLTFQSQSDELHLNGAISVQNNFDTQTVITGNIYVDGVSSITTTDDLVRLDTAVTLNAPLSIDTGAGPGNITFNNPVTDTGVQSLTLGAGTGSVNLRAVTVDTITFNPSGSLTLNGNITVENAITTASVGGPITVNGATTISTNNTGVLLNTAVSLVADLTVNTGAGAGNITLNSTVNSTVAGDRSMILSSGTGTMSVTGPIGGNFPLLNLTLTGAGPFSFPATTLTGFLQAAINGNIVQSGAILVGGTSTLSSTANITLNGANNFDSDNTGDAVSVTTAVNVNLNDISGIVFGASAFTGTWTVTAGGSITQTGAITQTNTGAVSFTAGAAVITLTAGNEFRGAVSLVNAGAGNDVDITDLSALDLGACTISRNLSIITNGDVTDSNTLAVASGTAAFTFSAGTHNITLNTAANNLPNVGIVSAANVNLASNNPINLATSTNLTGLTLAVSTCTLADGLDVNGSISVTGGTFDVATFDINVSGDWTIAAGATFSAQTRTVTFDGAGTPVLRSGGDSFNNLTVSGNTVVTLATDPVQVGGTLQISGNNDVFNAADRSFTINALSFNGANGRFQLDGTQAIQVITPANMDTASGTVRYYDGASGNGTILLGTFFNLTIDGNTNALNRTHTLTVNPTTVLGTLTVQSGTFATADLALNVTIDVVQGGGTVNAGASTVTVQRDLILSGGTYNAQTSYLALSRNFDSWVGGTAAGTFVPGTGTVEFVSGNVTDISGNNSFFNFLCQTDNKTIRFTANIARKTTTILAGGNFEINPPSGTAGRVNLISTVAGPAPWPVATAQDFSGGAIAEQWIINISINANRNIHYVNVDLSWSQNLIIIDDSGLPPDAIISTWCYNWGSVILVLSSSTYDADNDGKIDIYVHTASALNRNFAGFQVEVDGYELDPAFAATNYCDTTGMDLPDFIIRLRKDRTASGKRLLDTGAAPVWRIVSNSTLAAQGIPTRRVGPVGVDQTATDAVPPRFGYSLAAAGKNEVFIYFSEPVLNGAAELQAADFTIAGHVVTGRTVVSRSGTNPLAIQELVLRTQNPVSAADIFLPRLIGFGGGVNVRDQVNLALAAVTHRISDLALGVSFPPQEPIRPVLLADTTPREPDPTGGVGYITAFDGTGWIQDENAMHVLSTNYTGGLGVTMVWDTNVASNYFYNSLWLPGYNETLYNGLVPIENAAPPAAFAGGGSPVQFNVDTSQPEMAAEVTVDFFFRIAVAPEPLYGARLARPNASDWYRSACPWQFGLHRPAGQKGGVTIYNNVINPNNGETTKLHYVLPRAGNVTIQVFSLSGDLVDVLYAGWLAAGQHSTSWDGRNRGGRVVARGLYFIKIVGPDIDEARKVLVVK